MLQINFTNPLLISPSINQDKLVVKFKNRNIFYSGDLLRNLDTLETEVAIPKQQLQNDAATDTMSAVAGQASAIMQYVFIGALAFNVLMS